MRTMTGLLFDELDAADLVDFKKRMQLTDNSDWFTSVEISRAQLNDFINDMRKSLKRFALCFALFNNETNEIGKFLADEREKYKVEHKIKNNRKFYAYLNKKLDIHYPLYIERFYSSYLLIYSLEFHKEQISSIMQKVFGFDYNKHYDMEFDTVRYYKNMMMYCLCGVNINNYDINIKLTSIKNDIDFINFIGSAYDLKVNTIDVIKSYYNVIIQYFSDLMDNKVSTDPKMITHLNWIKAATIKYSIHEEMELRLKEIIDHYIYCGIITQEDVDEILSDKYDTTKCAISNFMRDLKDRKEVFNKTLVEKYRRIFDKDDKMLPHYILKCNTKSTAIVAQQSEETTTETIPAKEVKNECLDKKESTPNIINHTYYLTLFCENMNPKKGVKYLGVISNIMPQNSIIFATITAQLNLTDQRSYMNKIKLDMDTDKIEIVGKAIDKLYNEIMMHTDPNRSFLTHTIVRFR